MTFLRVCGSQALPFFVLQYNIDLGCTSKYININYDMAAEEIIACYFIQLVAAVQYSSL
jgi:hypothetical protein